MTSRFPPLRARLAALLVLLASPLPLLAQAPGYPALIEADPVASLSRYLRMLAANPRDLASLTGAGRAALAVGDANAALGFYARAEEIAPRNGRIKAGLAAALVQMEQPRAALKLFDEAAALGVPVGEIASDRGLASDLSGDGRRARADYTLALRAREDDETVRRLALSMAISGDRAGALTMLEPLLRRRDGGAIRARAFVLALTGDQAGAANAVRAAMPGPQATVMANFLARLGKLNPAQKALAVNFGYFPSDGRSYSAAELFADARAAPLPGLAGGAPIGARGDAPLIPAGEALGPRLVTTANDADARSPRRRPGQAETIVEVAPPPHVLRAPTPGLAAARVGRSGGEAVATPAARQAAVVGPPVNRVGVTAVAGAAPPAVAAVAVPAALAPSTRSDGAAVMPSAAANVAANAPALTASAPPAAAPIPTAAGASAARLIAVPEASPAATGGAAPAVSPAARVAGNLPVSPGAAPPLATPAAAAVPPPIVAAAGEPLPATLTAGGEAMAPLPIGIAAPGRPSGAAVIVSPIGPALAVADAPPPAEPPAGAAAAARLAPIATVTLPPSAPAATSAVAPPTASADLPRLAMIETTPRPTEAGGKAAVDAAGPRATLADPTKTGAAKAASAATRRGRRAAGNEGASDAAATDKTEKRAAGKGATGRGRAGAAGSKASSKADAEAAETKRKDAKAQNARRTPETKLASAEKAGKRGEKTADKAADKSSDKAKAGRTKEAAKEKDSAKEKAPERYWVQVASGANKANLDKAWMNVKGKAPKLLQGQTTYTAPWRASNRLLIGPYKTEEEAQSQVNKLAKAGVSGIQFTTRAGADVEKVAAK